MMWVRPGKYKENKRRRRCFSFNFQVLLSITKLRTVDSHRNYPQQSSARQQGVAKTLPSARTLSVHI